MIILIKNKIMNLGKIEMIRTALLSWCRAFGCVVARPIAIGASDVRMGFVISTFNGAIVVFVRINFRANERCRIALHKTKL